MTTWQLNTPVAFIIFNRPNTTSRVFEVIRQAKPPKLLVIADGARNNHLNDQQNCAATRAIIDKIDWNCELLKNYSDYNLGCRDRVSSGLNWVFEQVSEAIILEDDCLPHPSFFRFCEELLTKYRDDSRIMHISGDNFQLGKKRTQASYYFSRYNHCWGWASWRRAWHYYDVDMKLWSHIRDGNWLYDILGNSNYVKDWHKNFQGSCDRIIDSWDYQWAFACWVQSGLSILPNQNLVSNIGFSRGGTHTLRKNLLADLPLNAMEFPLNHPIAIARDLKADDYTQKLLFSRSLISKIRRRLWVNSSRNIFSRL
ncbi:glycosyltransferase family 2 protein [Pseudanabaena mucicola]|uniref:Glycosyltransferase family 2 protein n=1 Tax=Pseudanabaena mucicola FACHB-723 TaxID=2692860 RepID=A0ABR7ZWD9_9CYAN|nr:glycosyltransferase family 2 protein [Pseudanabaena mucicola]MBD2188084.1 glycosyltransferase family 2 protein [Pseudanabaena mucicola FACHB-723]